MLILTQPYWQVLALRRTYEPNRLVSVEAGWRRGEAMHDPSGKHRQDIVHAGKNLVRGN